MVMMEQCFSGGFNASIIAKSPSVRTSVAAACGPNDTSAGGPQFDPFARDWIAAMTGSTPSGGALVFDPDSNGDVKISAQEAFDYANVVKVPHDTPMFSQSSSGGTCYLGARWGQPWYWPLVLAAIQPFRPKPGPGLDPAPEFYRRIGQELLPRLEKSGIEEQMDQRLRELQRDLEPRIRQIVQDALARQ